jgi:hypothetical protein
MVCGPPPAGRARWTVRLVAAEAVKRGIAPKLGRETARVALADHGLKPWRKKNVVRSRDHAEFIDRMEDVLELCARKYDPREPVICFDERPVVLHADARAGVEMAPHRIRRRDYEYVRGGTANVFCIVEPLNGRRLTFATANRKRPPFVRALHKIAPRYHDADRIPHPRQSQYSFSGVSHQSAGHVDWTAILAPLRSSLHPETRELAECGRDRH